MKDLDIRRIVDWPQKTKMVVFGLVFVLTLYLGYLFDILELTTRLTDSEKQEITIKEQFEHDKRKEMMLVKDVSRYKSVYDTLQLWQKSMVSATGVPELLNQILKMGANDHLYFATFNPEEAVREGAYTKVPIKVLAVGTYHQIGDFVGQVANLPTLVVVRDFVISNEVTNDMLGDKLAAQAGAQGLLAGKFTLEIYYLTEADHHGA